MATVNIRRDVSDPFYRYKMERIQSKVEGKGNGIKTVIVNLSSVASSLSRPPSYVIKYFGFELGAQTNNNPNDDRWIINGSHEASKLQDYLDGFISKFVLCKQCKNPETDVNFKDGYILLDCKACGQRSTVDGRLKLSSFILKNQPKKGKKDKAEKKARRAKAKENGDAEQNGNGHGGSGDSNSDNADADDADVGVDAGSDDNTEAKELDRGEDVKDDVWAVDVSEEAVKARAKELPEDLKQKLVFDEGDEDAEGEGGSNSAYDQLGSWIISTAESKAGGVGELEDVEIYVKAKDLGVGTKHKTLSVLAQTIFDDNIVDQIPKRASMLKKMITSERHEKAFLGGTEAFVGKERPKLIAAVPKILLAYYQSDLVSENVLKTWNKASKKYVDIGTSKKVRQAAKPFLEWLENAESDEEESGEE
ncbi:eukaryotic translation initiation factor 5 [Xanthoria parietina]